MSDGVFQKTNQGEIHERTTTKPSPRRVGNDALFLYPNFVSGGCCGRVMHNQKKGAKHGQQRHKSAGRQRPRCPQPPKSSYLKNTTITSADFHSSKGPSPEVPMTIQPELTFMSRPLEMHASVLHCRMLFYFILPKRRYRREFGI